MKSILAPGRVSGQVEAHDAQVNFLVAVSYRKIQLFEIFG
jgi:hypothetical protein